MYVTPITITEATELKVYSSDGYGNESAILSTQFYKIDPELSITLETEYANQYNAGGNNALIDGIRGSLDFRTGAWQEYQDTDVIAIMFPTIFTLTLEGLGDLKPQASGLLCMAIVGGGINSARIWFPYR